MCAKRRSSGVLRRAGAIIQDLSSSNEPTGGSDGKRKRPRPLKYPSHQAPKAPREPHAPGDDLAVDRRYSGLHRPCQQDGARKRRGDQTDFQPIGRGPHPRVTASPLSLEERPRRQVYVACVNLATGRVSKDEEERTTLRPPFETPRRLSSAAPC